MHKQNAFTLIELLIVVAIIAILAAIAVPNFLEAQTRAKVARVRSDQRTLATALETYNLDNNGYPVRRDSWKRSESWCSRANTSSASARAASCPTRSNTMLRRLSNTTPANRPAA